MGPSAATPRSRQRTWRRNLLHYPKQKCGQRTFVFRGSDKKTKQQRLALTMALIQISDDWKICRLPWCWQSKKKKQRQIRFRDSSSPGSKLGSPPFFSFCFVFSPRSQFWLVGGRGGGKKNKKRNRNILPDGLLGEPAGRARVRANSWPNKTGRPPFRVYARPRTTHLDPKEDKSLSLLFLSQQSRGGGRTETGGWFVCFRPAQSDAIRVQSTMVSQESKSMRAWSYSPPGFGHQKLRLPSFLPVNHLLLTAQLDAKKNPFHFLRDAGGRTLRRRITRRRIGQAAGPMRGAAQRQRGPSARKHAPVTRRFSGSFLVFFSF